jgi:protein-disulfide isomerase
MNFLKNAVLIFCFLASVSGIKAQTNEILAVANGKNYTSADLDPATREMYEGLSQLITAARTDLLGQQIAEMMFEQEAATRKITVNNLLEAELKRRVTAPTEAQIKAVYDANASQLGGRTLAEIKPQIVDFLQREARPKALTDYVGELKTKHKVVTVKDVNAANLQPTDVLATIDGKPLTVQSFEEKAGAELYELKANIYDRTSGYLENIIYSTLVSTEAQSLGIGSSDLIAREISDKLRDYSDEEREKLQTDLVNKLFQKYKTQILVKEPAPFVQKIATEGNPSRGSATAPVTVVMFTDFQCPACSGTHPVLQKVMAEYGDKIRFVVRDFPLTSLHQNAFKAALAANAANAQGKFFEYTELLYNNQNALDTASLKKYAAQVGLNQKQFDADLDGEKYASEVRKDMTEGENYGINSTPTIYINGVKARNLSAQTFRKMIDRALKK